MELFARRFNICFYGMQTSCTTIDQEKVCVCNTFYFFIFIIHWILICFLRYQVLMKKSATSTITTNTSTAGYAPNSLPLNQLTATRDKYTERS